MGIEMAEVFRNREKYPDDMKFTLNGIETTVGELRNAGIPKEDFTKVTQQHKTDLGKATGQIAQLTQQLAQAVSARGGNLPRDASGNVTKDDLDEYLADPTFAPLARPLKALVDKMGVMEQTIRAHENIWAANQHIAAVRMLQEKDPDMRSEESVNRLIDFAKMNGIPNLVYAHQLLTRERDVKVATDKAKQEGIEEGKKQAAIPHIPGGRLTLPPMGDKQPKTLAEAENAALADPDVMKAYTEGVAAGAG
jgi:hypothetical protein